MSVIKSVMNLEDQILCLCTRQNFSQEHQRQLLALCDGQTVDWATVFETAEEQRVSPLVHANLEQMEAGALSIPADVHKHFKTAYIHNVLLAKGTQRMLKQVLALFVEAGVDVMLVKGWALNLTTYEQPWYTISGDVDLIIKAEQGPFMASDKRYVIDQIHSLNWERSKFQAFLEYDFYDHHDISMNGVLGVDASQLWERAYEIQPFGHRVLVLPPEEMLLTAAINSCRKRFLYLKSLCDIATVIERYHGLDWNRVLATAREWKADSILYTALVTAQKTIGCPIPDTVLQEIDLHPLRQRLILTSINFLLQKPLALTMARSKSEILDRTLSWSLLLTYATYPTTLMVRKVCETWSAWRHPPAEIPSPVEPGKQIRLS